jgi:hypothetical protein
MASSRTKFTFLLPLKKLLIFHAAREIYMTLKHTKVLPQTANLPAFNSYLFFFFFFFFFFYWLLQPTCGF